MKKFVSVPLFLSIFICFICIYYVYLYLSAFTVYSAIGAESLRIARASNNPESFSTAIKPIIACMRRQGVSIGRINRFILKFFNEYQADFHNVCQSKQLAKFNLLNYKYIFFYSFRPTNNIGCYRYADKTVMLVFYKYMKNKINKKNKIK